jgi:hypothetical protein
VELWSLKKKYFWMSFWYVKPHKKFCVDPSSPFQDTTFFVKVLVPYKCAVNVWCQEGDRKQLYCVVSGAQLVATLGPTQAP